MLIEGRSISYNFDTFEKGLMYGLFDQENGKVKFEKTQKYFIISPK
jgi:hypothetical protein